MNPNFAAPMFAGFEREFLRQNPLAEFGRYAEGQRGNNSFLDYLSRSYNRLYSGYLSEEARNPFATFLDYLKGNNSTGFDAQKEFQNLSPQDRGERPNSFVGRVRYVGL